MTRMPMDAEQNPIPCISLRPGLAHAIAYTGTAAHNTNKFAFDTQIISFYATTDCYIKFSMDGAAATSSDHFFPAGIYYNFSIGGKNPPAYVDLVENYKYVSCLQVSSGGTAYISECE